MTVWAIFEVINHHDFLVMVVDEKPSVEALSKIAARNLNPNDITIRWDELKDRPDMVDCRIWSNGNPNHVFARLFEVEHI